MEIGSRIRELRILNGLTQEELADRSELSKGFISQLENDLTSPSIATLEDILQSLGSGLSQFFAEEETPAQVVFRDEDYFEKVDEEQQTITEWIIPNAQKNMMEPIMVELKPRSSTEVDFPHEGEEFGFVLSGTIIIHVGSKKHKCQKGESFYITANKNHFVENATDKDAKFIWVSCPPTF